VLHENAHYIFFHTYRINILPNIFAKYAKLSYENYVDLKKESID